MNTRSKVIIIVGVLAIIAGVLFFLTDTTSAPPPAPPKPIAKTAPKPVAEPTPPEFNKSLLSLDDPTSLWVIVNKKRPLNPSTYAPNDLVAPNVPYRSNITATEKLLRTESAAALEKLVADAKLAGLSLTMLSGYRPFAQQEAVYNGYVASQGQATADSQSARPGYSEHQTGLAVDLGGVSNTRCDLAECYGDTIEGKWLAANAYRFGYVVRYQKGADATTGYVYEPWHVRYVGVELASELQRAGNPLLEPFFNLPAAPGYN